MCQKTKTIFLEPIAIPRTPDFLKILSEKIATSNSTTEPGIFLLSYSEGSVSVPDAQIQIFGDACLAKIAAAVTIQSSFRMYQTRKRLHLSENILRQRGVITIQRSFRRCKTTIQRHETIRFSFAHESIGNVGKRSKIASRY